MNTLKRFLFSTTGLWFLFITCSLFISNFWLPRFWGFIGNGDWDLTYSTFEVARISLMDYGEWPSFQPFLAFGSDLNANPQAVHASIFFIPILFFGSFYGYKISILIAINIGLWGAYKLFYSIEKDKIVAICMAIIFCTAPYFSRHIFEAGHSNFLYFYLFPWFLYHLRLFNQSGKTKHSVWLVLILVQTIIGGAPIAFIIFITTMVLWALGMIISKQSPSSLLVYFVAFIVFSLILSAWKILPVLSLWQDSPRITKDESDINFLLWLQALADLKTDTQTPHQWHELSIGFPLVLIGLSLYQIRKIIDYKLWLLLFIPIFWIGLGNIPETYNPWHFLNTHIPIFNSLRAPYRLSVLTLAMSSILFVITIKYYSDKQLIYIVLLCLTLTQTLSYNSISKSMVFSKRIELNDNNSSTPFQISKLDAQRNSFQYHELLKKHFVLNAYEPLNLQPISDSLTRFVQGGELVSFRPSRFKIMAKDSTVKICLRYNPNWSLSGAGQLSNQNGLLTAIHTSGMLDFKYQNPRFKTGLIFSLIGCFVWLVYLLIYHKKLSKK